MYLVQTKLSGNRFRYTLAVAGQHHRSLHTGLLQCSNSRLGVRLQGVGNLDGTHVCAVAGHMNDRARVFNRRAGNATLAQQLFVAGQNLTAIHTAENALTGNLRNGCSAADFRLAAGGAADGYRNGMVGMNFRLRGQRQQFIPRAVGRGNTGYGKTALGQRAGFVHHHDAAIGQLFHVIAALDQNARAGGAANAAEKAHRHGNDQRTGAGNDEEDQRAVNPPGNIADKNRRNERQQHRCNDDHRGVVPGKFGDELFSICFLGSGVFYQIQNLADGGFPEGLRHAALDHAGQVDDAAHHSIAFRTVAGQRFAGQRGGIQRCRTPDDHAVQRHPVARFDDDHVVHADLLGIALHNRTVNHLLCHIRADVHQLSDGLAGFRGGIALKQLAHLTEQHHNHAFGVIAGEERAQRCDAHQEILVKHLTVANIAHCRKQRAVAHCHVGSQIQQHIPRRGNRQQLCQYQQRNAAQNAAQHALLLAAHLRPPACSPAQSS